MDENIITARTRFPAFPHRFTEKTNEGKQLTQSVKTHVCCSKTSVLSVKVVSAAGLTINRPFSSQVFSLMKLVVVAELMLTQLCFGGTVLQSQLWHSCSKEDFSRC